MGDQAVCVCGCCDREKGRKEGGRGGMGPLREFFFLYVCISGGEKIRGVLGRGFDG